MVYKGICSIDGCGKTVQGRGLCPMHYSRARHLGVLPVRRIACEQCGVEVECIRVQTRFCRSCRAVRDATREDRVPGRREATRRRAKEYYWDNRERVLARMATPEGREYAAAKMRERFAKNPQFKLHSNISSAVRKGLAGKGRRRWEELVGYTAEELKHHIERQFTRGMGWHNYGRGAGRWHIDHIVPQSAFTFSSPEDPDFKACWALSNLRPMWGSENISKHASREFLL